MSESFYKSWKFRLYLLFKLPLGFFTGLRVKHISASSCAVSVPYKWLNQNPFKSMYFAVQSMAAELSTALPCLSAIKQSKQSIAFIIVDCKAQFVKKANKKTTFTCEDVSLAQEAINECLSQEAPVVKTFKTIGKLPDGTVVSEFTFTWSFKLRSS